MWQADLQLEPPFNERKISTCCYVSCVSPPPSPPTTTTTSNATFPSAIKKVHQLRCFLGFGRGGELEEMEGGWLWFLPLWQGLEEEMGVVLCKRPHWAYLFLRLLFPSPRPNAWQFWLDESAAKHFFFFLHAISTISAEAEYFPSSSSWSVGSPGGLMERQTQGLFLSVGRLIGALQP